MSVDVKTVEMMVKAAAFDLHVDSKAFPKVSVHSSYIGNFVYFNVSLKTDGVDRSPTAKVPSRFNSFQVLESELNKDRIKRLVQEICFYFEVKYG